MGAEVGIRPMFVLATVISTSGSTYRKSGARMAIEPDGKLVGMLSGGCLEHDLIAHSQQVFESRSPRIVTYDTHADRDLEWGFGLGCNGVVTILLELINRETFPELYDFVTTGHLDQDLSIATIVKSTDPDIPIGTAMTQTHSTFHSNVPPSLTSQILHPPKSKIQNPKFEVFLETLPAVPHVTIFGSGRDVIPVVQFAQVLGWKTTIVDCRAHAETSHRFPTADRILPTRRELLDQTLQHESISIAIVMTHNYFDDAAILEYLLPRSLQYIGLLGARQRSIDLINGLSPAAKTGAHPLHYPIGLDLGAQTPEEIALAIVAEIQTVLRQRTALFLKQPCPTIARTPEPQPS